MLLNVSGVGQIWEESFCEDFCRATKCVPALESLYPAVWFQPPSLTIHVQMFSVTLPTPQPTDDVDIYFETPADDKEHSRFQRAKEQLEIRHRSRMERVRICLDLP